MMLNNSIQNNGFYQSQFSDTLRFGDVVQGFFFLDLVIKEPILTYPSEGQEYKIDVKMPEYSVILTPCCSIENGVVIFSPLIEVLKDFFKNEFFKSDLTNINRVMTPEQSMPKTKWEQLSPEEQNKRNQEGNVHACLEYFIYAEHDLFKEYEVRGQKIRYYMIDFKNIYKVKCDLFQREKLHNIHKILELSINTRNELRDKIAYFYSRKPKEDIFEE